MFNKTLYILIIFSKGTSLKNFFFNYKFILDNGANGSESFFATDQHVHGHVGQYGRFEAVVAHQLPPAHQLRSLGNRVVNVRLHLVVKIKVLKIF